MKKKMPIVSFAMRADDVVLVTENHGGYLGGRCIACGSAGWIEGYGFPFGTRNKGNYVVHKKACPMNAIINKEGDLI